MRMISKVSKVSMAAAVSVALLAGACAPQTKALGYAGGSMLLVAGGASMLDLKYGDPDLDTGLAEILFGFPALIAGAGILIAAFASPAPPSETAPPASTLLPPPQSPSAPSGSQLKPVVQAPSQALSRSLSMRSGSPLAFH